MTASSEPAAPVRRQRSVLALLLLLGAWPWIATLDLWPMTRDGGYWISRGIPFDDGWLRWVFATQHFNAGYRPLTALSFSVEFLLAGLNPFLYRITDLLLHLGVAGLVWSLYRLLRGERHPATAWGAPLAAALVLLHPLGEAVVPYMARRSYTLALVLGLLGLTMACRALAPGRPARALGGRAVLAGVCVAASLLCNEGGIILAGAFPLLLLHVAAGRPDRWSGVLRVCLPAGLLSGLAVAARFLAIGELGGYDAVRLNAARFREVFWRAWGALVPLDGPAEPGAAAAGMDGAAYLLLLAVSVLLGGLLVARGITGTCGSARRLQASLGLWLAGGLIFLASLGVWFTREAYLLLPPFALLVASILESCLATPRAGRLSAMRAALLLPALVLVFPAVFWSPVLRGQDGRRVDLWRQRQAALQRMSSALERVSEPALVRLALPFEPPRDVPEESAGEDTDEREPTARRKRKRRQVGLTLRSTQASAWLATLVRERDIEVENFLYFEQGAFDAGDIPRYRGDGRPGEILLTGGRRYHLASGFSFREIAPAEDRWIAVSDPPLPPGRNVYLFIDSPAGGVLEMVRPLATNRRPAGSSSSGGSCM